MSNFAATVCVLQNVRCKKDRSWQMACPTTTTPRDDPPTPPSSPSTFVRDAVTMAFKGAYQHETFNEQTGIGETKHGLPLGCLNIKLIRLDGMEGDPQVSTRPFH